MSKIRSVPCTAHSSRTGEPCRKRAIAGATVCRSHGGASPQVKAAAKRRLLDIIDPDRVFREMARIGFADTTQIFDEAGNVRPVKDWPPTIKRALAGIEIVKRNINSDDGQIDEVLKVKFWDKPKALEQMAKVLQMFEEHVKHSGSIEIKWQD